MKTNDFWFNISDVLNYYVVKTISFVEYDYINDKMMYITWKANIVLLVYSEKLK